MKLEQAVQSFTAIVQYELDFDAALVKHRIAATQVPNSALLWNNIGMCFFGKGNNVAATACLKRALYLSPFDWTVHYNLGLVHLNGGQLASAFHFLKAAINLNTQSSDAYGWLGVTLAQLDDEDNALAAFERALQLDE
jgi:Bardet-Biedl syndrome 4 protein